MAELTDELLEKAGERIVRRFSVNDVIGEVLTNEEAQVPFINALSELKEIGVQISVGGRRLRELLGCKTTDFATSIVSDAEFMLTPHQEMKLGPLLKFLCEYPTDRMSKPDLDFFIWNSDISAVVDILNKHGFNCEVKKATGKVFVINIYTDDGNITFVQGEHSFQTGSKWPQLGFTASFEDEDTPLFKLDIGFGRLYIYPLTIPEVDSNPISVQRVAAIGRTLLWATTVSVPSLDPSEENTHTLIGPPDPKTQSWIFETIEALPQLLHELDEGMVTSYGSGLRDIAIALRIIIQTDWDTLITNGISEATRRFFRLVSSSWFGSLARSSP